MAFSAGPLSRLVLSALCLCFLASWGTASQVRAGSFEEPPQERQPSWVQEAQRYTEELVTLARDTPRIGRPDPDDQMAWFVAAAPHLEQHRDNWRKGDQVLWKLWLVTGRPPLKCQDKPLHEYLQENATAYHKYTTEHIDLAEEEIVRLGLTNCVETFASPRWYMTLRYLNEKVGFRLIRDDGERCYLKVHVTPSSEMVESPLPKESYGRLGGAFKRWLADNESKMVWDHTIGRFRPVDKIVRVPTTRRFLLEGSYLGSADLTEIILAEMFREIPNGRKDADR